jgi:putative inorganic carbon (hco3(-)) transporter
MPVLQGEPVTPPLVASRPARMDGSTLALVSSGLLAAVTGVVVGLLGANSALVLSLGALAALIAVRPQIVLYAMVLMMPVDYHTRAAFGIDAPFDILRYAVALSVMARWKTFRPTVNRFHWLGVAAYAAAVGLSLIWMARSSGAVPYESLRLAYKLGSYIAFSIAAWLILSNVHALRRAFALLAVGVIATSAYSVYQFRIQDFGPVYRFLFPNLPAYQYIWVDRPTGLLIYSNTEAAYLDLLLPVLVAVALIVRERLVKLLAITATSIALVALLLTQSRGGWFGAAVCLVVVVWFTTPGTLRLPFIIIGGAAAGAAVLGLPFLHDRATSVDYSTLSSRLGLWSAALQLFLTSPIVGTGYGSYPLLYGDLFPLPGAPFAQAHSLYLNTLAETGILGVVTFGAVFAGVFRDAWRDGVISSPRNVSSIDGRFLGAIGLGIAIMPVGVLADGVVDVIFPLSSEYSTLFWMLTAIGANVFALRVAAAPH